MKVKNVERDLFFQLHDGASDTVSEELIVDTMQCHSLVNRLFSRQGMNVLIESIEIGVQPGGSYTASILRLPQHWSCINAWSKGMALWRRQQDETADQAELYSTYARYRDFKVGFDIGHLFQDNLIPMGYFLDDPLSTADTYEWQQSQIVIPNDGVVGTTTERLLHLIGDSNTTRSGLINAYAESRSRPATPDPNIVTTVDGGIFGEMFDVGMDDNEIIENFQEQNNEAPYLLARQSASEYYPGGEYQGRGLTQASGGAVIMGQFVDTLGVNASANYNSDRTGSFAAPCGLIKILVEAGGVGISPGPVRAGEAVGGPLWMRVRLAPGGYQGIAAIPMQEAN
jgi:hypothetical protein